MKLWSLPGMRVGEIRSLRWLAAFVAAGAMAACADDENRGRRDGLGNHASGGASGSGGTASGTGGARAGNTGRGGNGGAKGGAKGTPDASTESGVGGDSVEPDASVIDGGSGGGGGRRVDDASVDGSTDTPPDGARDAAADGDVQGPCALPAGFPAGKYVIDANVGYVSVDWDGTVGVTTFSSCSVDRVTATTVNIVSWNPEITPPSPDQQYDLEFSENLHMFPGSKFSGERAEYQDGKLRFAFTDTMPEDLGSYVLELDARTGIITHFEYEEDHVVGSHGYTHSAAGVGWPACPATEQSRPAGIPVPPAPPGLGCPYGPITSGCSVSIQQTNPDPPWCYSSIRGDCTCTSINSDCCTP